MFPPLFWFSEGPQRAGRKVSEVEERTTGCPHSLSLPAASRSLMLISDPTSYQFMEEVFVCLGRAFFSSEILLPLTHTHTHTHINLPAHMCFHSQNHNCSFEFQRGGGITSWWILWILGPSSLCLIPDVGYYPLGKLSVPRFPCL